MTGFYCLLSSSGLRTLAWVDSFVSTHHTIIKFMQHSYLTEQIIAAAYTVHNTLGAGYLEKVYENAMLIELDKRGLHAVSQQPIPVLYESVVVGDFFADLFVEDCIIVELKATENLHTRHEAQLVNYLTSTGHDIGLLINFGSSVTVKRKHRTYRRTG